jgi:HAD superfamily hydrolase (TIGR01509 family)
VDPPGRFRACGHRTRTEVIAAAVGFDIDHTLLIDNKLERVAFLHVLDDIADHGGGQFGTLTQETIAIDDLLARQRAGQFSIEEAVMDFARRRGVGRPEPLVEKYKARALGMVSAFVVPEPGARAIFGQLHDLGMATAVLTNGWNPLQQAKADAVGFAGPLLVSAELGASKPSRPAFEAMAAALGVPPSACWYVGDDPRCDVAGALAAGMRAVWLDAEGVAYPPDMPEPTATVHSLEQLARLLQGAAPAS